MKKALLALAFVAIACGHASAINRYWDINGTAANTGTTANGTWSTAATNWNDDSTGTGGTITGWAVTTDTAVFSSGGSPGFSGNSTITASGTPVATGGVIIEEGQITLSGRVDVNTGIIELKSGTTLVQASSGGATGTGFTVTAGGGYLISGNATLRQTNGANAGSFVATAATLAITNNSILTLDYTGTASPAPISIVQQAITGSGSIVKNGVGIIRMGIASSYSGSTTINAGELRLGGSAANRLPIATDLIINGGIFNMGGSTQNQQVASLSGSGGSVGGGGATLTINGASGTTTYSGLLADTSFITATTAAGTTGTLTLVKNGASTQVLSGANTYTGLTTITGGVLAAGNDAGLGTGAVSLNGGTLATSGGARTFAAGKAFTLAASSSVQATDNLTINGTFTNSGGNRTLTASANTGTTTLAGSVFLSEAAATSRTMSIGGIGTVVISGNIANASAAGAGVGSLTIADPGSGNLHSVTLSGNNTYTGNTTLNIRSNLNINSATALGTGKLIANATQSSTFDNTSGSAITLSNTNNIDLSGGSPTFVGTNDLSFGNNTVAIIGAGRTITTTAGKLTIGSITEDVAGRNFTKAGAGTLETLGTVSNTGAVNVNGGTFLVSPGANISAASAINVNNSGTVLTLNGTISVGSTVTVGAGATLNGTGSMAGNLASSGTLSPGNSVGTLTISGTPTPSLSLVAGDYKYELATNSLAADLTRVAGDLNITAGVALNASDLAPLLLATGIKFTLINYGGLWNGGIFNGLPNNSDQLFVGPNRFQIRYNDTSPGVNGGAFGNVNDPHWVTITTIPEASSFIAFGLCGILAIAAVRMGKRYGFALLKI